MRWNDTRGDTVVATRVITDMICDGVSAFFGPEGTCHVEAIVSQSRNIPMISYVRLYYLPISEFYIFLFYRNALITKLQMYRHLPERNHQIRK